MADDDDFHEFLPLQGRVVQRCFEVQSVMSAAMDMRWPYPSGPPGLPALRRDAIDKSTSRKGISRASAIDPSACSAMRARPACLSRNAMRIDAHTCARTGRARKMEVNACGGDKTRAEFWRIVRMKMLAD
ncbi:hypothetical protein [Noviherbaspirillum aerium]|uniref:hypothetical protein n=1 Tax=Noviherbaspirillum aerium TaxID=2588497 RepID=UPI00124CB3F2|nr:hypothetical protein [Noviherbaspirillum aerium]